MVRQRETRRERFSSASLAWGDAASAAGGQSFFSTSRKGSTRTGRRWRIGAGGPMRRRVAAIAESSRKKLITNRTIIGTTKSAISHPDRIRESSTLASQGGG